VLLLLDTSGWIEYLRDTGSSACAEVARLLRRPDSLATTEPIVMELLAGAPTPRALRELETLTAGGWSCSVSTPLSDYHNAAAIHRAARSAGHTDRRMNYCLIAAVAARTGGTLVHQDADLDIIAESITVKTRRLV